MASLEGWNFTIKLCPRGIKLPRQRGDANSFFECGGDESGVVPTKTEGVT